jgi:hypothetical protein
MQGGYLVDGAVEEYDNAEDFVAEALADPERTSMDAMVARPTLACECKSVKHAGKIASRTMNFGQSKRFRWWVHLKCKRPTRYVVDHFIANMLNGHADLLGELIPGHKTVVDPLAREARQEVDMFRTRQG